MTSFKLRLCSRKLKTICSSTSRHQHISTYSSRLVSHVNLRSKISVARKLFQSGKVIFISRLSGSKSFSYDVITNLMVGKKILSSYKSLTFFAAANYFGRSPVVGSRRSLLISPLIVRRFSQFLRHHYGFLRPSVLNWESDAKPRSCWLGCVTTSLIECRRILHLH